jgi:simple sugar transport system ATP-binding protein
MRVEVRGIRKTFGSLVANDDVSLDVGAGEVHALLGENGAGKSTLMNVLFGMLHADAGEIFLDGEEVRIKAPGDAVRRGLGMVHQHFMLVPVFTVAENVVLGNEPTRMGQVLDRKRARERIHEISGQFGLEVDPDATVEDLPVGLQQRVEILKALSRDARCLILDEPTAVLTPTEIEALFAIMRSLKATGRSVLFITHKLKEVLEIADRITVMRRGRVAGTTTPKDTSEAELAEMMVGRQVSLVVEKQLASAGDVVLQVDDLRVTDDRGVVAVDGVSLEARAGEVLAVAGVQGNGQTELVEAITGLRKPLSGKLHFDGADVTGANPRTMLRRGLAHIPEDRHHDGLVLSMSIADNLVLDRHAERQFASIGTRRLGAVRSNAAQMIEEFDIRTDTARAPAKTLSGGNQQKVVVARELSRPIRVLIAGQPTRGLDVGSIEYVHRRIVQARDEGAAVVLVSSELDEIMALGDRIAVMFRGRVVGVCTPDAGREAVGLMMAGAAVHVEGSDAVGAGEPPTPAAPAEGAS